MKLIITCALLLTLNSCQSQSRSREELENILAQNIETLSISKLTYFESELIDLANDSVTRLKIQKRLANEKIVKRNTDADSQELAVQMNILFHKIKNAKTENAKARDSQAFILHLIEEYNELSFKVEEKLIRNQIDYSKRSLRNGYDAGSASESRFFFLNNFPTIFKEALIASGRETEWLKSGTFVCNYLRENDTPLEIRYHIKSKVIQELSKYLKSEDAQEILKDINDCDVSANLFD